MKPFADSALELAGHGLVVIPLGGDDGKKPLVGNFNKWRGQRRETVEAFASKFPETNIGIVHGKVSGTVVADVDHPAHIEKAIARLGDTPLVVETPRGGVHLFYRHNGERCADLRGDGLEVDIKSTGGITTAPPSVRPSGQHRGKPYRLLRGTWADRRRLPAMKLESAPAPPISSESRRLPTSPAETGRNNTLFRECLKFARGCPNLDALMAYAYDRNLAFTVPLPSAEVAGTAASAWRIQCEGRNRMGQVPQFIAPFHELSKLQGRDGALDLYVFLKGHHDGLRERFCISASALSDANAIPGWGRRRYTVARDHLLECGFIRQVHKGGSKRGDASQFVFSTSNSTPITISSSKP